MGALTRQSPDHRFSVPLPFRLTTTFSPMQELAACRRRSSPAARPSSRTSSPKRTSSRRSTPSPPSGPTASPGPRPRPAASPSPPARGLGDDAPRGRPPPRPARPLRPPGSPPRPRSPPLPFGASPAHPRLHHPECSGGCLGAPAASRFSPGRAPRCPMIGRHGRQQVRAGSRHAIDRVSSAESGERPVPAAGGPSGPP